MSVKHPADRGSSGERTMFDRFSEASSNFSSSPLFFGMCVALVAVVVACYAAGTGERFTHGLGDAMTALTLLLVALLKNAELRSERAIQAKLDAIAAAMLEDEDSTEAREDLKRAIGMHDEV